MQCQLGEVCWDGSIDLGSLFRILYVLEELYYGDETGGIGYIPLRLHLDVFPPRPFSQPDVPLSTQGDQKTITTYNE